MFGQGKQWPELVGVKGEEASNTIKGQHPEFNVIVLPENSPVTRDLRMDRVRIFVDGNGVVSHAPHTG